MKGIIFKIVDIFTGGILLGLSSFIIFFGFIILIPVLIMEKVEIYFKN